MLTYFILSVLVSSALSYPFGSPSCTNSPKHGGQPQSTPIDVQMTKDLDLNGNIVITLGNEGSQNKFKGFLIKTKAAGVFSY